MTCEYESTCLIGTSIDHCSLPDEAQSSCPHKVKFKGAELHQVPSVVEAMTPAAEPPMLQGKRPRGRPLKHGMYSKYSLVPLTHQKSKEIMDALSGQRLLVAPSDQIAVNLLARLLAQIELMGRWLGEHGMFTESDEGKMLVSPIMSQYVGAIKHASSICGTLGLTTESRIKLTKGIAVTEDLASKIQRLKEE